MATASLVLDIIANDRGSQAINNFASKVGSTFEKLGQKIGGEFGNLVSEVGQGLDDIGRSAPKLGSQLQAIGGAALAAGTALQFLGSKDRAAQQQLQAAITATGSAWGDYQVQIEKAIKAGENFGKTADETQNALATLTSATNDPAKALANMAVVEDLAAARHIDLNSAATLVAKTLEGSTKLLKAYGISTDGVAKSTDKAQAAVNQLATKLSGQAAASVNTFAGQFDIAKAKVTDFVSQLAGPVGAGLQGFGAGLALIGTVMESGFIARIKTASAAADGFRGKMSAIAGTAGPLTKFGIAASAAAVGLDIIGHALQNLDQFAKGPNAVLQQLQALGMQDSNFKQFANDGDTFANTVGKITDPGLVDRLNSIGTAIGSVFGSGAADDAQKATQRINELDQGLTTLVQNGQGQLAAKIVSDMVAQLKSAGKDTAAFLKLLPGYTDAQVAAGKAAGDAATTTSVLTGKLVSAKQAYDDLTHAMTSFNDANINAQKADIATRDALVKVNDALKKSKGHLDLTTQAGRDARSAVLDFASAVDTQAQSLAAEGKPHAAIVALYHRERDALQQTLTKMGLTRAEARRYADSLLKIPKSIQTQLTLEITAHLAQVTYAKSVARGQGAHVAAVTAHRAAGGPVLQGSAYMVGERGPETFVPNTDGRILPTSAGAATTVINHITVNVTNGDPNAVVRAIKDYTRANSNRWAR